MTKSPQELNQLKAECYQLIDKIAAGRFGDRLLPAAKRFLQIYATGVPIPQDNDEPLVQLYRDCSRWMQEHDGLS